MTTADSLLASIKNEYKGAQASSTTTISGSSPLLVGAKFSIETCESFNYDSKSLVLETSFGTLTASWTCYSDAGMSTSNAALNGKPISNASAEYLEFVSKVCQEANMSKEEFATFVNKVAGWTGE